MTWREIVNSYIEKRNFKFYKVQIVHSIKSAWKLPQEYFGFRIYTVVPLFLDSCYIDRNQTIQRCLTISNYYLYFTDNKDQRCHYNCGSPDVNFQNIFETQSGAIRKAECYNQYLLSECSAFKDRCNVLLSIFRRKMI